MIDPELLPFETAFGQPELEAADILAGARISTLHGVIAEAFREGPIILGYDKYDYPDVATFVDSIYGEPLVIRRGQHHPPKATAENKAATRGLARWTAFLKRQNREPEAEAQDRDPIEYDYFITMPGDPSMPGLKTMVKVEAPKDQGWGKFSAVNTYKDTVNGRPISSRSRLIDDELVQTLVAVEGLMANGLVRSKEAHEATEALKPQHELSQEEATKAYLAIEKFMESENYNPRHILNFSAPLKYEVTGNGGSPYSVDMITIGPLSHREIGEYRNVAVRVDFTNDLFVTLYGMYWKSQFQAASGGFHQEQLVFDGSFNGPNTIQVALTPRQRLDAVGAITEQVVPGNLSRKLRGY